jgi:hypothetical protein
MANTYTPAVKLGDPAANDTAWNTTLNNNFTALDALNPVGDLAVTTHEQPSATLTVDVAAGQFVDQSGNVQTYAGVSGQAITLSTTKVLYLDGTASWALTVAASYPATPHIRLATVVAGATTITSIADNRQCFPVAGSIADGVNLSLGTVTGTQIATTSSQKLGFFGKTPIVRPTMGAATAGGTYTAAEQAMLNAVYSALRNLGLGS